MSILSGMNSSFNKAVSQSKANAPAAPAVKPLAAPTNPTVNAQMTAKIPQPAQPQSPLGGMFDGFMGQMKSRMSSPEGFAEGAAMLKPIAEPMLRYGGAPLLTALYGKLSGNDMWSHLTSGKKASYSRYVKKADDVLRAGGYVPAADSNDMPTRTYAPPKQYSAPKPSASAEAPPQNNALRMATQVGSYMAADYGARKGLQALTGPARAARMASPLGLFRAAGGLPGAIVNAGFESYDLPKYQNHSEYMGDYNQATTGNGKLTNWLTGQEYSPSDAMSGMAGRLPSWAPTRWGPGKGWLSNSIDAAGPIIDPLMSYSGAGMNAIMRPVGTMDNLLGVSNLMYAYGGEAGRRAGSNPKSLRSMSAPAVLWRGLTNNWRGVER